jgi:mRNA interferase MazF
MALVRAKVLLRGEVHLVSLDPTRGSEIKKTRPCVIVSPDELNAHLQTVMIAPLTTSGRPYPFRVACRFGEKQGFVVLDQVRTVDRDRLRRRLGRLSEPTLHLVLSLLREMFEL